MEDITLRYGTTYEQKLTTDDATADNAQFITVTNGTELTIKQADFALDDGKYSANLTLDTVATQIDTPEQSYKVRVEFTDGRVKVFPEPDEDCIDGDCTLPKLFVCDIPEA